APPQPVAEERARGLRRIAQRRDLPPQLDRLLELPRELLVRAERRARRGRPQHGARLATPEPGQRPERREPTPQLAEQPLEVELEHAVGEGDAQVRAQPVLLADRLDLLAQLGLEP